MPRLPSNQSAANRFDPDQSDETTQAATQQTDAKDASATEGTMVEYVTALVSMHTNTSTLVEVPEWEIDILREIHGPESIKVESVREVSYPYTAWMAMQYLKNKYSTREQADAIKAIYPRLRDFARSTGLPYVAGDDAKSQVQASSVIFHDNPNTAAAKTAALKQSAAGSGTSGSAGG